MRNDPEKYSALVYHDNDNQSSISSTRSRGNNGNLLDVKSSRQAVLPPPPYDEYIIEDYKAVVLEEAEKLYNVLVDQLVCEAVNENIAKQSAETIPSSLPALPLEGDDNKQEPTDENETLPKDIQ
jgi:hypothetical protein